MLSKSQIEKYADVLVWGLETSRPKPFKPYDVIFLRYQQPSIPLAEALYRKLLQRKWIVVPRGLLNPVMEKDFYTCTDSRQRTFIG